MTVTQISPDAVAAAIADKHADAVEFPSMMFAEDAPVGKIAQRMVDGRYDKAFVISEIERFTGLKVNIPATPGKMLAVIPQHGYWASELTLTDQVFRAAGYEVDYATPRGERPWPYGVSMDTTFRDQAWNAAQVSPGESALASRYNDKSTTEGKRLNTPRNLNTWLPPTPRPAHGSVAREPFRKALQAGLLEASQYAGLFIVGGAGAYMDLGGNTSVRPLIELFSALGRPVAAICYGVEVLIQATDPKTKTPPRLGALRDCSLGAGRLHGRDNGRPGRRGLRPQLWLGDDHARADGEAVHRAAGRFHLQERQPVHGCGRRTIHQRADDPGWLSGGAPGPGAHARRRVAARKVRDRQRRPRPRTDGRGNSPNRRLNGDHHPRVRVLVHTGP